MTRLFPMRTRFQRDVGEIENYFETYSRRHPGVVCTMLRYQPGIGPSLDTQITRYLSLPVVPTYLGFDPRLQFVHEHDALEALVAAVRNPVRGAVNVAAPGTIGLTRMVRLAGRPEPAARARRCSTAPRRGQRLGLLDFSDDFRRLLRYGRGVGHHPAGRGGGLRAALRDGRGGRGLPAATQGGRRLMPDLRQRASRRDDRRAATRPLPGRRSPSRRWASCAGCARAWTPASSCRRRSRAAPRGCPAARGMPCAGRPGGSTAATRRTSGASTRSSSSSSSRFFEFLYERWWRVRTTGVQHVPGARAGLLVSNHAGILPWDATMISFAILREHPLPRYPRFLVLNWAFDLPFISVAMRKVGGVVASPYNAIQLLQRDELVAVFPEGVKGAGKAFRERYRLQRFGRGGFVEIALRTGSPIVPVAVVGSEEIYPKLGESRAARPAPGSALLPAHAHVPLARPARRRAASVQVADRVLRADPTDEYGPDAAEDRTLVFELSERVRETIQEKVYENLVKRGAAFV